MLLTSIMSILEFEIYLELVYNGKHCKTSGLSCEHICISVNKTLKQKVVFLKLAFHKNLHLSLILKSCL